MRITIRLVALVGIVAVAALALASLPVVAQDDVSKTAPRLNPNKPSGGIMLLDRRYDNDQPSPSPIVPPDKEPKPGRLMSAPNGPYNSGETIGGANVALLGGRAGATLSKTDRVEKSLQATADKLR